MSATPGQPAGTERLIYSRYLQGERRSELWSATLNGDDERRLGGARLSRCNP